MPIDKEASRRWRSQIRKILNIEWNPIGAEGLPDNEYDQYADGLAAMIRDGATDEDLVTFLFDAQTGRMGIPCSDLEKLRQVIRSIRTVGWMQ